MLTVQIIDYPGEWLLDLPLLEQSYEAWSAATLRAGRDAAARRARQGLAELRRDARSDGARGRRRAAERARRSTPPICAAARSAGLGLLQPGRFTMPGDLAGSDAAAVLPAAAAAERRAAASRELMAGALRALPRARWSSRFYREHFSRFDRQIVLVDLLGALNRGPGRFADTQAALETVLEELPLRAERPARAPVRDRASRRCCSRSARPTTSPTTSTTTCACCSSGWSIRRPAPPASRASTPAFVALAALRSTDVVRTEHHGQVLSCVRGVIKGEERETVLFPGEIPPDLPEPRRTGAPGASAFATSPRAACCCTAPTSRSTSASTRRSRR